MRGKLRYNLAKVIQIRITPADAGKTYAAPSGQEYNTDHPRGCGENPDGGAVKCLNIGSPPRMRGKRWMTSPPLGLRGITPADAGKTYRGGFTFANPRDHPRGCGENYS